MRLKERLQEPCDCVHYWCILLHAIGESPQESKKRWWQLFRPILLDGIWAGFGKVQCACFLWGWATQWWTADWPFVTNSVMPGFLSGAIIVIFLVFSTKFQKKYFLYQSVVFIRLSINKDLPNTICVCVCGVCVRACVRVIEWWLWPWKAVIFFGYR